MRIEQITFTRFLAAISIIVFHFGRNTFLYHNKIISFLFQQANLGVSYFFILSGFVMIIAYGNKPKIKIFEYLKNRVARIYPVYLLAILLLFLFLFMTNQTIDYYGMILNIFAVQAYTLGHALSFNYPGWSLSVEFFFYFIFPFLFNYIYVKKDYRKLVFPIILIWLVSNVLLHLFVSSSLYHGFPSKSHDLFYYFPLMHLNEFLVGNLIGLLYIHQLKDKIKNYDLQILLIFGLLIIALKYPIGLNFHNGILSLLFVPLILFISLNNGLITSIFKNKYLSYLGEISYGIYILQVPIYFISNELFNKINIHSHSIRFFTYCLILIIISALSYNFIETPLRNRIKKIRL